MIRIRSFHDPATGKVWGTRTDGINVTIFSGMPGKLKETDKPQADAACARRYLDKEEGARLRKGLVLVAPAAASGEPIMLRHLGGGYTGALAIAELDGGLLLNRYDDARQGDEIWRLAPDGSAERLAFAGPNTLLWRMLPVAGQERVLLLADHQIRAWTPATGLIEPLTRANGKPASFLDCQGAVAAWHEQPELVVRDLAAGKDLLRLAIEPELYGGHTPQLAGALSADGALLAYCVQPGRIQVLDIAGGTRQAIIEGDFKMVGQLAFTPDRRALIVKENYGGWRLLAFDLASAAPLADWPEAADPGGSNFAVDAARGRIAFHMRGHVHVHELATMRPLSQIAIDQIVKRVALTWTADGRLGTRTDLGCVGLYAAST
ncbi:WD40 repeat domain-containing protein [Achromobacter sp. AONIH1]|uniref:WD40 repeat domain-containing protein n=1 Tax=Achromobacter sp. AONIH1 TaxID=1758194 RepID=UPI000CD00AFB|nr:hypothetical protein [Achromobacter sp. AONIH1]AUT48063.1 hypothetical protein C2U31_19915 [Achromobacter sp. AONIH1]